MEKSERLSPLQHRTRWTPGRGGSPKPDPLGPQSRGGPCFQQLSDSSLAQSSAESAQGMHRKRAVWEALAQDVSSGGTSACRVAKFLSVLVQGQLPLTRSGVSHAFTYSQPRTLGFAAKDRRGEKGATAVEYGIMVALIAVVIIVAVTLSGWPAEDHF